MLRIFTSILKLRFQFKTNKTILVLIYYFLLRSQRILLFDRAKWLVPNKLIYTQVQYRISYIYHFFKSFLPIQYIYTILHLVHYVILIF